MIRGHVNRSLLPFRVRVAAAERQPVRCLASDRGNSHVIRVASLLPSLAGMSVAPAGET